jgi:thiol-disulfide isomerase/thioredoxin
MSVSSNKLLGVGMQKKDFLGDMLMGAALGPVFSTCSPTYFVILATVLPSHFTLGLLYLFAYSLGLGLALLAISLFGQTLADKLAITADSRGLFKRTIGIIFIAVALLIITSYDKKLERFVTEHIFDVTRIEHMLLASTNDMSTPLQNGTSTVATADDEFPSLGRYQEITSPAGFVNTNGKAIKLSDYIGKKIILIDFMTYSCINCVRTFPYLIDWNTKYKDKGLITIGIHTPEFAFEKKQENVEKAMKELGITFPVVLDNTYGTWNAYKNQYWPRKYIIDLKGNIVFDHIGEGKYDETEKVIQKLLMTISGETALAPAISTKDTSRALSNIESKESYLGYSRLEYATNDMVDDCHDKQCLYTGTLTPPKNSFSFIGNWTVGPHSAQGVAGSKLVYHFKASKIHLVMGSAKGANIRVTLDGNDQFAGVMRVKDETLYTLTDLMGKYEDHTVTIEVIDGVIDAYAFTFS